jgi:regulation of enolase protein 1 (concanavalin A-like superfamily)
VNLQYRAATGGQSFSAASVAGVAPRWLRLKRSGNTFTASWSTDGVTFVNFGTVTVAMQNEIRVGLALTNHNTSVSGSARFDDVQIIQP